MTKASENGKNEVDWLETSGSRNDDVSYFPCGRQGGLKPGTTNGHRQTNQQERPGQPEGGQVCEAAQELGLCILSFSVSRSSQ